MKVSVAFTSTTCLVTSEPRHEYYNEADKYGSAPGAGRVSGTRKTLSGHGARQRGKYAARRDSQQGAGKSAERRESDG